jgi:hypothetical protein
MLRADAEMGAREFESGAKRVVKDVHLSSIRLDLASQHGDRGRLAGAVGSYKREDLAALDAKGTIVERGDGSGCEGLELFAHMQDAQPIV